MSVGYLKKCSSQGRPKKQHRTQAEAEEQRANLVKIGRWTWGNSNTYWCNQCGFWHAGKLGRANRGKGRKQTAKHTPRFLATQ